MQQDSDQINQYAAKNKNLVDSKLGNHIDANSTSYKLQQPEHQNEQLRLNQGTLEQQQHLGKTEQFNEPHTELGIALIIQNETKDKRT